MRLPSVGARVLPQLKKLFDRKLLRLQIAVDRALALAALIHRDSCVVDHLQKWNDALAASIYAVNTGVRCADAGPIVPESSGPLESLGVVVHGLEDALQVVARGAYIA